MTDLFIVILRKSSKGFKGKTYNEDTRSSPFEEAPGMTVILCKSGSPAAIISTVILTDTSEGYKGRIKRSQSF